MGTELFIGTVIVAIVELIKYVAPKIVGPLTIIVAALIGLAVALLDTHIGLPDISIAIGIMTGLGSAGVVYTASRVNTDSK